MRAYGMPEYAELDAYRLEKDWSWAQLAEAMKAAGAPVTAANLHFLCTRAVAGKMTPVKRQPKQPQDRTIYKIRKFLGYVHENDIQAHRRAITSLLASDAVRG